MHREHWDTYFMRIAASVATRATCDRKHVGAVVVSRERSILATGYNGSARGLPHCDDAGHLMRDGHCVRTVHAEMNVIAQAARNGTRIDGAAIYVTAFPCLGCMKVLANAGIERVVYAERYNVDAEAVVTANESRIRLIPELDACPACAAILPAWNRPILPHLDARPGAPSDVPCRGAR